MYMNNGNALMTKQEYDRFVRYITDCLVTPSTNSIKQILAWTQERIGCDAIIICYIKGDDEHREISRIINLDYPEKWIQEYISRSYILYDPILKTALDNNCIHNWKDIIPQCNNSNTIIEFIKIAKDYGLRSGLTLAKSADNNYTSEHTVCSFANIDSDRRILAEYAINTLTPLFHRLGQHLNNENSSINNVLTKKEKRILEWAMYGKSVWDISVIANVKESTVKFHFQNIYKKLNVCNRTHAVARAIQLGIL